MNASYRIEISIPDLGKSNAEDAIVAGEPNSLKVVVESMSVTRKDFQISAAENAKRDGLPAPDYSSLTLAEIKESVFDPDVMTSVRAVIARNIRDDIVVAFGTFARESIYVEFKEPFDYEVTD